MSEFPVRIVKLEPLRVASVHGFGPSPEEEAWQKLVAWAKPKGYLDDKEHHRIFGFNNPDPSPGSPNYGYEFWMVVGAEVQPEAGVEIKDFPGGLYAAAHCAVQGEPWRTIPAAWKKLVLWRENSQYQCASHQWLEEHLEEEGMSEVGFNLDLYLPIAA
jgi:DNA gyrase inhibitor GyrI